MEKLIFSVAMRFLGAFPTARGSCSSTIGLFCLEAKQNRRWMLSCGGKCQLLYKLLGSSCSAGVLSLRMVLPSFYEKL